MFSRVARLLVPAFQPPVAQLWQDEGATVAPLMNVYKEGYFEFRCQVSKSSNCYGGAGVFLDRILLTLFPKSFLEKEQTIRFENSNHPEDPKVGPWLGTPEYPNIYYALRMIRGGFALLLIFTPLLILQSRSLLLGLLGAAAVTFANSFSWAFQGVKNDYPLAFFIGFLSWSLLKNQMTSYLPDRLKGRRIFTCLAVGVSLIKISAVPFFVFLYLGFFIVDGWDAVRGKHLSQWVISILETILLAAVTGLILSPNSFHDNEELLWFRELFTAFSGGYRPPLEAKLNDLILLAQNLPPLILAMGIIFLTRSGVTKLRTLGHLFPFVLGFGAMAYFSVSPALHRVWYYLPIYFSGILWLSKVAPKPKPGILAAAALIVSIVFSHYVFRLDFVYFWRNPDFFALPKYVTEIKPVPSGEEGSGKQYWVDINNRHAIEQSQMEGHELRTFDSLTETPRQVLLRIQSASSRLEKTIVLPCWGPPKTQAAREVNHGDFLNPIVETWYSISKRHCKALSEFQYLSMGPHTTLWRLETYQVMSISAFEKDAALTPLLAPLTYPALHTRVLSGSSLGQDYWENWANTYMFNRNLSLTQTLKIPRGKFKSKDKIRASVRVRSNCKISNPTVTLLVNNQKSKPIYGDVYKETCSFYSNRYRRMGLGNLCDSKLGNLYVQRSRKFFDVGKALVEVPANSDNVTFQIILEGLKEDRPHDCQVLLDPIRIGS